MLKSAKYSTQFRQNFGVEKLKQKQFKTFGGRKRTDPTVVQLHKNDSKPYEESKDWITAQDRNQEKGIK